MTFVDANIPMYLVGGDHPHKADAAAQLQRFVAMGERLVTSAEVFQEMLHRYSAIKQIERVPMVFQITEELVDEVYAMEFADAKRAAVILAAESQLSSRDAIHLAVMERMGIRQIWSFDSHFDRWPGITRVGRLG